MTSSLMTYFLGFNAHMHATEGSKVILTAYISAHINTLHTILGQPLDNTLLLSSIDS